MKALVCVKRVIDYNVKIRVKTDKSGVETENVKMSMNPFDEIAVEEAVKLKEKGVIDEIIVLSIGAETSQETIRTGLAMGGDRGVLVKTNGQEIDPLNVGKIIKSIFDKESPDMVILGKQAIDDDCNQTGQILSSLLDCHQATFASKVEVITSEFENIPAKTLDILSKITKVHPSSFCFSIAQNRNKEKNMATKSVGLI